MLIYKVVVSNHAPSAAKFRDLIPKFRRPPRPAPRSPMASTTVLQHSLQRYPPERIPSNPQILLYLFSITFTTLLIVISTLKNGTSYHP